eukprot:CAMPEP_0119306604 /NCGR_PEP_ID=MMETSP1333-20130426/7318_1 /TAXON_ID=418940 /ORGANISM="Scyphosphaera apsteinii, Strain RCC1455" /LENGTH=164 /DNA_ID=CAMNT_0007309941 /DNA_START=33 /DNA_END=527 /DNA_ORIENTATION=-
MRRWSMMTYWVAVLCREPGGAISSTEDSTELTKEAGPKAGYHMPVLSSNPYASDTGDATPECYEWAANGECRANADYMHSNCRYSCWEWYEHRRAKYPHEAIDKHFNCFSWARAGECEKNSVYMRNYCPESCEGRYDNAEGAQEPRTKSKKKRTKKKAASKEEL